jgi:hypothetical protein
MLLAAKQHRWEDCYSYDVVFIRRASQRKDIKMGQEGHGFVGRMFLRLRQRQVHPE